MNEKRYAHVTLFTKIFFDTNIKWLVDLREREREREREFKS